MFVIVKHHHNSCTYMCKPGEDVLREDVHIAARHGLHSRETLRENVYGTHAHARERVSHEMEHGRQDAVEYRFARNVSRELQQDVQATQLRRAVVQAPASTTISTTISTTRCTQAPAACPSNSASTSSGADPSLQARQSSRL